MMKLTTRASALAAATALVASALTVPAAGAQEAPNPDELVVSVVGDGSTSGNVAVPVALQHFDATGARGATVAIPSTGADGQYAFTLGADRDQAGAVQQSADRQSVSLGGYDAEPGWTDAEGSTSLNGSSSDDITRVVATLDAAGAVDVSTGLGPAFNERHVRGVASVDGSAFWAGGHGNDTAMPYTGGVQYAEHGTNDPTPITQGDSNTLNNSRVPVIHDGQLFVSSDRADFHGVNRVGTGLPTATLGDTASEMQLVAAAPEGAETPHDFAFVGDDLYVNYTEGARAGIVRYAETGEGNWSYDGHVITGEFWGLTGREAGDDVVLYATEDSNQANTLVAVLDEGAEDGSADKQILAQAEPGYAFRGVAFAPGFAPGTASVELEAAASIEWTTRMIGGQSNALSAVLGDPANPVAEGTVATGDAELVDITATANDPVIVADDALTVEFTPDGSFTLAADPTAAGTTHLTVTATLSDGQEVVSYLDYWVSDALADPTAVANVGLADASTAQEAGDGYLFVADDDSNHIRLYAPEGGEPVNEFLIDADYDYVVAGQTFDIESSARAGDVIFWIGSQGNSRSGNVWLDRGAIIATQVTGSGADAELTPLGWDRSLRDALVTWDTSDAHGEGADYFGFARATADGYSAEGPDSLNIEGATMAADGTTLLIGFRSPLVDGHALLLEVPNIADVVVHDAELTIGDHHLLDLGGRAIRAMTRAGDGNYLISAGSADDAGDFALYGWSGDPEEAPVRSQTDPSLAGWAGSYESLAYVDSLADGSTALTLQDVGTVDIYGNGTEAQDLPREMMKHPAHEITFDFSGAFDGSQVDDADTGSAVSSGSSPSTSSTFGTGSSAGAALGIVVAIAAAIGLIGIANPDMVNQLRLLLETALSELPI